MDVAPEFVIDEYLEMGLRVNGAIGKDFVGHTEVRCRNRAWGNFVHLKLRLIAVERTLRYGEYPGFRIAFSCHLNHIPKSRRTGCTQ